MGACLWWAIWNARNKVVFEKRSFNIQTIINEGLYWYNSYKDSEADDVDGIQPPVTQPANQVLQVIPPVPHFIKVNADAAVAADKSYAAAIARDEHGSILGAGSVIFNTTSPLITEAHSFLLAIDFAQRLEVILQKKNKTIPWRIIHTTNEIGSRTSFFNSLEYSFIPKRSNYMAHDLATYAKRHNVLVDIFPNPILCSSTSLGFLPFVSLRC
ncbi:uncharacterized protein LOC113333468 [Papaver somniferum]|uniref:uncharacterized protein LOC113333468 n=1 Tax=Papaver somniferum TaxID=3469 RepID=UPI000E6F78D3|nr:uncharacterized protein LOC113333468 [Papaver somniferum]